MTDEERDAEFDLIIADLHFVERQIQKHARRANEIRGRVPPQMVARIINSYERLIATVQANIEELRQIPGNPDASEYRWKTKKEYQKIFSEAWRAEKERRRNLPPRKLTGPPPPPPRGMWD
jgi:hypothetical protein